MAMRPRGGSSAPKRGAQPRLGGVRPVYETFRPMFEWEQNDESHILNIYLPGFMKEQIKVSTEGRNSIRVRGERLVAGNKWSRFQEDFQVPENGEMNSVRAKYQGGILTIAIPKIKAEKPNESLHPDAKGADVLKQPIPEKVQDTISRTTQPPSESLDLHKELDQPKTKQGMDGDGKQSFSDTVLEKISPAVGASRSTNEKSLELKKESGDSEMEHFKKDRRNLTPPKTPETEASEETKNESSESKQNHIATGGQDDLRKGHTVLEEASPSASRSTNEKSSELQKASGDPEMEHDKNDRRILTPSKTPAAEASDDTKNESGEPKENHIATGGQDDLRKNMPYADGKKSMDSRKLPEVRTAKKMESQQDRPIGNPDEKEEKQESYGAFKKAKYNNAAKGLAELNEERQLLVNMGISVLVIVTLTAYVTYKFVSGKDKE